MELSCTAPVSPSQSAPCLNLGQSIWKTWINPLAIVQRKCESANWLMRGKCQREGTGTHPSSWGILMTCVIYLHIETLQRQSISLLLWIKYSSFIFSVCLRWEYFPLSQQLAAYLLVRTGCHCVRKCHHVNDQHAWHDSSLDFFKDTWPT